MKTIVRIALIFSIWTAIPSDVISIEPANAGWAIHQDSNNSAGPGGNLQDLSSVDLTDCCGGPVYAR